MANAPDLAVGDCHQQDHRADRGEDDGDLMKAVVIDAGAKYQAGNGD